MVNHISALLSYSDSERRANNMSPLEAFLWLKCIKIYFGCMEFCHRTDTARLQLSLKTVTGDDCMRGAGCIDYILQGALIKTIPWENFRIVAMVVWT